MFFVVYVEENNSAHKQHGLMALVPGLKRRPRTYSDENPRDPSKWGWYMMAVIAVLWLVYSLFFNK